MDFLLRPLVLIHRYLGIALCVLFIMWFVSGIAMMYSRGMPRLSPELRLDRAQEIDFSTVKVSPANAAAGLEGAEPERAVLMTVLGRPAWRFSGGTAGTVFADDGTPLKEIDATAALAVASQFSRQPESRLMLVDTLAAPDQWTFAQRQMPQYRIAVDDGGGTELYVSGQTGEITVMTTRGTRALAWVGAIPHWLYFKALRSNGALWSQVVIWASLLGCIVALAGIVLGIVRMRFRKAGPKGRVGSITPYRGWMRWHHITGLVFGVFTLTWVFSGLLSMEPWGLGTSGGREGGGLREQFATGPAELAQYPLPDPATWSALAEGSTIKEVELVRVQDQPYFLVRTQPGSGKGGTEQRGHQTSFIARTDLSQEFLVDATRFELRTDSSTTESLLDRVLQAWPEAAIAESSLLTEYDAYYYSRDRQAPLPVLRVKMADAENTWLYIDPRMSQLVGRINSTDRVERWLFNALHSLDFPFWYDKRPLWDIVVIFFSLGGILVSTIGLVVGIKRLRLDLQRLSDTRSRARA